MNRSLFEDQQLFNDIREEDVVFPLFFKNKSETIFTRYNCQEKFEQLTINKPNESFRGNILFGFNELIHDLKGDLKIWFYVTFRNHIKIKEDEYEKVFESIINGRQEFFNGESMNYIEKLPLSNKPTKHRWKPIDY